MLKSNDTLLCHIIATDEMIRDEISKSKVDELLSNPTQIKVAANELVYIHFIHSNDLKFEMELKTATQVIKLNRLNTIEGSCNTIIRCLSDVKIKTNNKPNFFVQLIRIQFTDEEN